VERSQRRLLNAIAKAIAALPPGIRASAIPLPSVRAALAFSGESRSPWAYRWNALSSTRWERTAALLRLISAPQATYLPSSFGEADPPFAKRATVQRVGKVTGARAAGTREFLSRVPA
jgi:hypothetical protein